MPDDFLKHRHEPRGFFIFGDGDGSRTRRFGSDVEHGGSGVNHPQGMGEGFIIRVKLPAVGEGIGSDIENPHQERTIDRDQKVSGTDSASFLSSPGHHECCDRGG